MTAALLTLALAVLALNKTISIVGSTWWIVWGSGTGYAADVRHEPPMTREDHLSLIRAHHGEKVWPFGVKSVRLYRNGGRPADTKVRWLADAVVHITLRSAPWTLSYVLVLVVFADATSFGAGPSERWALFVLAVWAALYSVALLLEAIVWRLAGGNYYSGWAQVRTERTTPDSRARRKLKDVAVHARLALVSVASLTVLVSASQAQIHAWRGEFPRGNVPHIELVRLLESLYYVLGTLITTGDNNVSPAGKISYAIAILILLSAAMIAGLALTRMFERLR